MEKTTEKSPSQPQPASTSTSEKAALCLRCRKKSPKPNDSYCWVCGPLMRAKLAEYVKCSKCGVEVMGLESSGVCRDCDRKAEAEKAERGKRKVLLAGILGGEEAVKKFTFDSFVRVQAGENENGTFCGNATALDSMKYFNPRHHSAYVWGPPGSGKTHLALATAAKCHMDGFKVAVYSPRELVNRFKVKDPREEAAEMKHCVTLDLIIINDLGISKITGWAMELICEIYDRRAYQARKGIIITSNLFVEELGKRYEDDRLASRVTEHSTFLEVNPGRDFRVPQ